MPNEIEVMLGDPHHELHFERYLREVMRSRHNFRRTLISLDTENEGLRGPAPLFVFPKHSKTKSSEV
jgi:hypothetical protein